MFDNIASTLKKLSTIILVAGILVSIVSAIAFVSISDGFPFVAAAICFLIGGILVSCVSACSLYGFGELIEKATEIAENTKSVPANKNANVPNATKTSSTSNDAPQSIINATKNQYDNAIYTDGSFEILVNAVNHDISACIIHHNTKKIHTNAFEYCSKLNNITIPKGVASIGNYTFYSCTELKSITIPNSVTSIGFGAFRGCNNLTKINYVGTPQEFANLGADWKLELPDKIQIVFKQQ